MLRLLRKIFFIALFISSYSFAEMLPAIDLAPSPAVAAAIQQLEIERQKNLVATDRLNELTKNKRRQLQLLRADQIDQVELNRAELDVAMAQVEQNAINLALDDIHQSIDTIKKNISDLESQVQDANIPIDRSIEINKLQLSRLQATLAQQKTLLKIQQARLKNLLSAQNIVKQRLELVIEWRNRLQLLHQTYEYEKRRQSLENLELAIQNTQQQWLKKLAVLNQQMKMLEEQGLTETPAYARLAMRIFEAEERSSLSHIDLVTARLSSQVENLGVKSQQEHSITDWNAANQEILTTLVSLKKARELIEGKISLINQHEQIGSKGKASGIIDAKELSNNLNLLRELASVYKKQLDIINHLLKISLEEQKIINKKLRGALAKRQNLPGFSIEQWFGLAQKIAQFPALLIQMFKGTQQQLFSGLKSLGPEKTFGLILLEFFLFMLAAKAKPYLQRLVSYYHDDIHGPAANSVYVILELIRRNLKGIALINGFILLFFIANVSTKIILLLFSLAGVWFSFNSLNELIKIAVFENREEKSEPNINFYPKLKAIVILGGILTTFIILTRQLPVYYEVEDIFNRIFMIFLLFISLVLFKTRRVIASLMSPYLLGAPHYLKRIAQLLTLLIPGIMFSTAIVGLIGYVELAWTIFRYEAQFLLILMLYLTFKGVIREILERVSQMLIRNSRNGWLWSEAFLKPLDKIIKIAVFLFAGYLLSLVYGLDQNSYIVIKLNDAVKAKLFSIAGSDITLLVILEFFVIAGLLVWTGKWSRELSYRWLFSNVKDVGLRNSFSVFTQYVLVTIGVLICLKVIGINLFALTAVAGAFAFGIGLGLRDLANNFACGILLLIERPLRKGDLVTINGYEGEVTHIGMRSITLYTGDLTDAVVPNAEAFSRTFINWTLRHHIVRGVIQLKLSPHDDPHLVQAELLKTIQNTSGVISNPMAEVYLKEVQDGLLDFEARYYINLKLTASRAEIRSKILFAIWDCFKRLNIQLAPQAEQDINIKSFPLLNRG